MDFLRDQEIQLEGINTFDMENDTETEPKAKKPKKMENYFLEKAVSFLEQPKTSQEKDEATIYSESWAVGFRKMDERQKLFAKRLIDDAILQGQLGNLSSRSFVSLERQSLPHYMHPSIHYSHSNSHSPITTSTQYSGPRSPLSPAPFHYPQPGDSNIHIISNEIIQSPIQKLLNDPEYQDYD
ncbi:uncharacterized protein LOC129943996 [Eupeodes corollae]|uniref:uncharacterized protein LOC129943996 n=1 Tax=Eupeodes corollae TaxID=290404 RepID=UPI0024929667|nr:uncharacterized protein LOC129943996 [Eupeodes corollae]